MKNTSHIQFAKVRYHLEVFMLGRVNVGAHIALWLSTFWLRFLYTLGPMKKFTLSISQWHPLINDLDMNLMSVDKGGVNGEYVRLVHEIRRYLDIQWERMAGLPAEKQFPKPEFKDKLLAFMSAFFHVNAPSAWNMNVYSDVD